MFEGVVSQVLAGFLGRYVKGIQKDQLKIGIWNEEILLENVELILEAFDYLQFPFALKNGQAGKLSIKIPWKKLGWDPIIIVLEDVFISACEREDTEWSFDSVDKREIAGKMAKLNAIELAKFSSRVTDNRTGQSFLSYMSAKILDNIQVSIRNVHVVYVDTHKDMEKFIFGLKFSSLTVMTDTRKHNFSSSIIGKSRSGHASKIIEISTACFYCNRIGEGLNNFLTSDFMHSEGGILEIEGKIDDYIIEPFDITISVLANKLGKLDGAPQYDIDIQLNGLVLSTNEIQIQQMFSLADHLTICALREKYGRYRPSQNSLINREEGWQLLWWHYARDSVLSEVRKKLRKNSWSTLGQRLTNKRRYVNLYKRKLELLQKEQLLSKDILQELEEMDKECDIDDILNYRACAEKQLQEGLSRSRSLSLPSDAQTSEEKPQAEEQSSSRGRRWLNWLSLGMLGAGGTADASSFAGVVSDEIIKDITEGMEFHAVSSANEGSLVKEQFYTSSIKLAVSEIIVSISLMSRERKIAEAKLSGFGLECKARDNSASIFISLESFKITNPDNENLLLILGESSLSGDNFENQGALNVQIDLPDLYCHTEPLIQVVIHAFEAVYDPDFFLRFMYLQDVLLSIEMQHNRVMSSLNRFDNFSARVFSKVEYLSLNRKKLCWDINIHNFVIRVPLQHEALVFKMETLHIRTIDKVTQLHNDILPGCDFKDLYDNFEVNLMSCEVKILAPNADAAIFIMDKSNGSVLLSRCLLLDEPKVKQLEADCKIPSVHLHFSKKIYRAISEAQQLVIRLERLDAEGTGSIKASCMNVFTVAKLNKVRLDLYLDYDLQRNVVISYTIGDMDVRYTCTEFPEVCVTSQSLEVEATDFRDKPKLTLLSSNFTTESTPEESFFSSIGCLQLNYQFHNDAFNMRLNNMNFHLYPEICGLLSLFFRTLNPVSDSSPRNEIDVPSGRDHSYFGFSNYGNDGIMVNQFPFLVLPELRNYYCKERIPLSKGATKIFVSLNSIKLHFHDWSCVLSTSTLLEANVSVSYITKNCWDFLMSVRGVKVVSPLGHTSITGLLLGPLELINPNIASVRIRKVSSDRSVRPVEVRFAFQNTCCILPSEYLTLMIGYFDLPEWDPPLPDEEILDVKNIWYQFELVDSVVFLPVEKHEKMCLRVGIPKLYGRVIKRGTSVEAGVGLPPQCVIKECLVPDKSDIVDIFGRSVSMSFCALAEQTKFMEFEEYMPNLGFPLIDMLNADMFVRMPWNTGSISGYTSVPDFLMMHLWSCSLVALDAKFLPELNVLADVMDEFSIVRKESRKYQNDALLYLQNKKSEVVSVLVQRDSILSMKLCLAALSVDLSKLDKLDPLKHSSVATAHIGLDLSLVLVNQIPVSLSADISTIVLNSSVNRRILMSFTTDWSDSSHFQLSYSVRAEGANEIFITVPLLDIWLYLVDWDTINKHLNLYTGQNDNPSNLTDGQESPVSPKSESGSESDDKADLFVNCENFSVRVHLPILQREGDEYKHISFAFQGKNIEAYVGERFLRLKIELEMLKVLLKILQDGTEQISIPFIQITSLKVAIGSTKRNSELVNWLVEVKAEMMDMGLSYQVFGFLSNTQLELPEKETFRSSCSLLLKVDLRRGSILLSDGRWSYHGPIMEAFLKNVTMQVEQMDSKTEASMCVDLLINYNNIDKVMWEPFVEPWSFHSNFVRKVAGGVTRTYATTDVHLKSLKELNINITEPLIEALFRVNSMLEDSRSPSSRGGTQHSPSALGLIDSNDISFRRYAPYIISNETGLPLRFKVFRGPVSADEVKNFSAIDESNVPPGYCVPIYVEEVVKEFFFRHREARSSEQLIEKKLNSVPHHMISVQFEGTSGPSMPVSMDFVGVTSFEVDFSTGQRPASAAALTVPVILEVLMQHYSKMIRLYSTVVLFNDTSMPLQLRFEIPLGVSSTVIGPIQPGQEIPLPLHLSEAGRIRWRPVNDDYLWSETHLLSSLLSHENKLGFMRSFVCYPSHPSNDPIRCCISVNDYDLPFSQKQAIGASRGKRAFEISSVKKKHFMRQMRLTTPLVVKNYLPIRLSLTIDCCGSAHSVVLSEVDTASIFLVDSSNDLAINIHIDGYNSVMSKFPRAELFSTIARRRGLKYSWKETISFFSDSSNGSLNIILERSMDAYCGARELCLFVPFLIYNSTDLVLALTENNHESSSSPLVLPSICNQDGNDRLKEKCGLSILSSGSDVDIPISSSSTVATSSADEENFEREVKAHMYIPPEQTSTSEPLVKLSASAPLTGAKSDLNSVWSSPFLLVPSSGSTNVSVPMSGGAGAFLVSAISVPVSGELAGRTRAIAFHPRFVICNACSKDIFFKQKGTRPFSRLNVGKHTYLHSSDTTREFLVSIRFDGPGWQWSGSFLPDRLGDTQIKMLNYVSGISTMVRVEVQHADFANYHGKSIQSNGNSATLLILLSDDRTGFMPYRIENFSMEKLRVHQHRCESIETTVHPYTSCQYAWDEPFYPHRLIVEVPGERVLGAYNLDDEHENMHVYVPASLDKPERTFCISIYAEGAMKVLSVVDSSCHTIKDMKETGFIGFKEREDMDQKQDDHLNFTQVVTLELPVIGISLISSSPQELLFACAKDTKLVFMQSFDRQKVSFKMPSLQIDNQLSETQYPVMLSFDRAFRRGPLSFLRKERKLRLQNERTGADSKSDFFYLAATRWRAKDASLLSFQHINIAVAPLCIELEERLVLSLLDFFRTVSSRLHARSLENDSDLHLLESYRELRSNSFLRKPSKDLYHVEGGIKNGLLPSVVPIGAPFHQIYLLARRQRKIYVELFELAPIELSLSFTSSPWLSRSEVGTDIDTGPSNSGKTIQRGLMALIEVEAVPVHLKELVMENLIASLDSIEDILVRHYTRQVLHEMYKVFGSAGVIGNPMGFARNVGLGLKDFFSASSKGLLQSPRELVSGIAEGSRTLLGSTIYAISSATTQFSKTAYKGISAFTFDERAESEMDEWRRHLDLHGKGVLNGFLEGLTGLLQSPIRGLEKHGLPGVVSGIAMGTAGLVARPMASILEATGKTAQSIRNRSNPLQFNRLRVRFPRPLQRDLPLFPYSWEEAIGNAAVKQANNHSLQNEAFVMCKPLRKPGHFVVITENLLLVVSSSYLTDLGQENFNGVPSNPGWVVETRMNLKSVVHMDRAGEVVNIVGSNADTLAKQRRGYVRNGPWIPSSSTPLFHASVELRSLEEAEDTLQVISTMVEKGRMLRWDSHVLHRSNLT
ncbi:hypothetical protein LUZ63_009931 [Rhynchospora breviuscula]|uniref:Vacuolar protein sorting-associated protein n=1 Tax=Rhynchospora breviuscula TaxID=2022672 RepID=A0A9Q0CFZ9_9POAL|nr:hypothetical protein LUZ63_009931 [Rhynchospora breviuscula]